MHLNIDHIGYAVKDMASSLQVFSKLGYTFSPVKPDEYRNVNVCIASKGGVKLEILSPLEGTKSPIDGILTKNGATPYHICYCVEDIENAANELREAGFVPIGNIAKSEPLDGNVCFLFSSEIGIIELIERK